MERAAAGQGEPRGLPVPGDHQRRPAGHQPAAGHRQLRHDPAQGSGEHRQRRRRHPGRPEHRDHPAGRHGDVGLLLPRPPGPAHGLHAERSGLRPQQVPRRLPDTAPARTTTSDWTRSTTRPAPSSATEFVDDWKIVAGVSGNAAATDPTVVSKSHRPVQPFRDDTTTAGDANCDVSIIDADSQAPQDQRDRPLADQRHHAVGGHHRRPEGRQLQQHDTLDPPRLGRPQPLQGRKTGRQQDQLPVPRTATSRPSTSPRRCRRTPRRRLHGNGVPGPTRSPRMTRTRRIKGLGWTEIATGDGRVRGVPFPVRRGGAAVPSGRAPAAFRALTRGRSLPSQALSPANNPWPGRPPHCSDSRSGSDYRRSHPLREESMRKCRTLVNRSQSRRSWRNNLLVRSPAAVVRAAEDPFGPPSAPPPTRDYTPSTRPAPTEPASPPTGRRAALRADLRGPDAGRGQRLSGLPTTSSSRRSCSRTRRNSADTALQAVMLNKAYDLGDDRLHGPEDRHRCGARKLAGLERGGPGGTDEMLLDAYEAQSQCPGVEIKKLATSTWTSRRDGG